MVSKPSYDIATIARLARDPETRNTPSKRVAEEAYSCGADEEDIWDALQSLQNMTFVNSAPTKKGFAGTASDAYIGYVPSCHMRVYIKFLAFEGKLVVTSFKEDTSFEFGRKEWK
jgi:hypothetical protein